jgi:RNA-binding protein 26
MYGMPGGEIPSVGKVELAWVQTAMLPSTSPSGVNNLGKSDEMQSEGDAIMQDSTPTHGDGQGQRHHQDLDYDVADDNDWGTS